MACSQLIQGGCSTTHYTLTSFENFRSCGNLRFIAAVCYKKGNGPICRISSWMRPFVFTRVSVAGLCHGHAAPSAAGTNLYKSSTWDSLLPKLPAHRAASYHGSPGLYRPYVIFITDR